MPGKHNDKSIACDLIFGEAFILGSAFAFRLGKFSIIRCLDEWAYFMSVDRHLLKEVKRTYEISGVLFKSQSSVSSLLLDELLEVERTVIKCRK